MIITRCFETANDRSTIRLENLDEPIVFRAIVKDLQPTTALVTRYFDQNLVANPGDVDRYQYGISG